jgi:hypothetical protein
MAKSRKRGQNESSIHHRADGRWEARLNLGWHDGKRVRKGYFAATREEVAKLLAAAKTDHDRGVPIPHSGITVAKYLTVDLRRLDRPFGRGPTNRTNSMYATM